MYTRARTHISMCGLPGLDFHGLGFRWHDATFCLPLSLPFSTAPRLALVARLHSICLGLAWLNFTGLDWTQHDSAEPVSA